MGRRAKPFQQVTAVNFRADVDYFNRVQDIFSLERGVLRTYNEGLEEFVLGNIDAQWP